jgi:hypothetical protein
VFQRNREGEGKKGDRAGLRGLVTRGSTRGTRPSSWLGRECLAACAAKRARHPSSRAAVCSHSLLLTASPRIAMRGGGFTGPALTNCRGRKRRLHQNHRKAQERCHCPLIAAEASAAWAGDASGFDDNAWRSLKLPLSMRSGTKLQMPVCTLRASRLRPGRWSPESPLAPVELGLRDSFDSATRCG